MEQVPGSGLLLASSGSPRRVLPYTGNSQTARPVLKPEDETPPRTRRGGCELPSQRLPRGLIINAAEGHFSQQMLSGFLSVILPDPPFGGSFIAI